jgi:hypothetical protein
MASLPQGQGESTNAEVLKELSAGPRALQSCKGPSTAPLLGVCEAAAPFRMAECFRCMREVANVTNVCPSITPGASVHSVCRIVGFPSKVIPFLCYTL